MGARSPLAITVPAALAGGALWGLCFAVRPWLPLCLVGLVPLFLLLQQRRAWLFGWLHGIAMSRHSGCWVGMKVVTDVVEGGGSVYVAPDAPAIVVPEAP